MSNNDIKKFASELKNMAIKQGDAPLFAGGIEEGAIVGARWAAEQMEAKNKALREVLKSVSEQIEDLAQMMNNGKIPPVWKQIYNEIKTLEK